MTHLKEYAERAHQTAVDHGFWEAGIDRNFGEMLALMHSELSEALEEHRSGKSAVYYKCSLCGAENLTPKDEHYVPRAGFLGWLINNLSSGDRMVFCEGKIDKPEGGAVELVDCIIRIFDAFYLYGVNIEEVMDIKMNYNDMRPYKHGREY